MKGQHPAGESNDNVNTLLIFEQICEFFPVGIENQFQKMEGIAIQKSGLKKITKNDLRGFPKLKSISLFGNQLITLESNLFLFNTELKLVSLFNNKLKHVFSNIFDGLNDLERVYLSSNPCISEEALNAEKLEQLKCKLIENCSVTDEMIEFAELETEKMKIDFENRKLKENLEAVTKNFISTKRKLEKSVESYKFIKSGFSTNDTGNCAKLNAELRTCENDKAEYFELIQDLEVVEIVCGTQAKHESKSESSRCKAVGLKVLKPHYQVVRVKNADKSHFSPELAKKLEVSDQQTLFVPLLISKFFPMLTILSIKSSELIMINEEAFNGLECLDELNLSYNQLTFVKAENFVSLKKLSKLDLSHNKIEFIEPLALNGLMNLVELRLNHNLLLKLNSKFFTGIANLKIMTLHNNSLSQIASNFLEFCCEQIEVLDFSDNQCLDATFPGTSLDKLKEIFLVNCTVEMDFKCRFESELDYFCHAEHVAIESRNVKIKNVKGDHKRNLTNSDVTFLRIVDQSMEVLPRNLAKFMPGLKRVWIENSKLVEIEIGSLKGFIGIEELTIKLNFLKEFDDETFKDLTELQILDLSSNLIEKLPQKAFVSLTKLKTLNLSNNKLTALDVEFIPAKNMIERFVFKNNRLTSINPQIIKLLKSAKLINFEGNKCIGSCYDETSNDERKVMEIFGEISFKCIED